MYRIALSDHEPSGSKKNRTFFGNKNILFMNNNVR